MTTLKIQAVVMDNGDVYCHDCSAGHRGRPKTGLPGGVECKNCGRVFQHKTAGLNLDGAPNIEALPGEWVSVKHT